MKRAVGCTHEGRRTWREGANEVHRGFIPATFAIHMRISKTFTSVLFTAALLGFDIMNPHSLIIFFLKSHFWLNKKCLFFTPYPEVGTCVFGGQYSHGVISHTGLRNKIWGHYQWNIVSPTFLRVLGQIAGIPWLA